MKLNIRKYAALMACACGLTITSCTGDLDVTPINPQQTQVANDDALFNKLYATFSLTGQQGNAGKPDIPSNVMENEGFTQYYRMQWYLNEFTSDEAAWTWSGNDNLQGLMYNKYTANEGFALGLYYRLYFDNITLGYSFDRIGKSSISGRVYATAQNVFTITKYKGIDPEIDGGYDSKVYPRPFTCIVGVSLNF